MFVFSAVFNFDSDEGILKKWKSRKQKRARGGVSVFFTDGHFHVPIYVHSSR